MTSSKVEQRARQLMASTTSRRKGGDARSKLEERARRLLDRGGGQTSRLQQRDRTQISDTATRRGGSEPQILSKVERRARQLMAGGRLAKPLGSNEAAAYRAAAVARERERGSRVVSEDKRSISQKKKEPTSSAQKARASKRAALLAARDTAAKREAERLAEKQIKSQSRGVELLGYVREAFDALASELAGGAGPDAKVELSVLDAVFFGDESFAKVVAELESVGVPSFTDLDRAASVTWSTLERHLTERLRPDQDMVFATGPSPPLTGTQTEHWNLPGNGEHGGKGDGNANAASVDATPVPGTDLSHWHFPTALQAESAFKCVVEGTQDAGRLESPRTSAKPSKLPLVPEHKVKPSSLESEGKRLCAARNGPESQCKEIEGDGTRAAGSLRAKIREKERIERQLAKIRSELKVRSSLDGDQNDPATLDQHVQRLQHQDAPMVKSGSRYSSNEGRGDYGPPEDRHTLASPSSKRRWHRTIDGDESENDRRSPQVVYEGRCWLRCLQRGRGWFAGEPEAREWIPAPDACVSVKIQCVELPSWYLYASVESAQSGLRCTRRFGLGEIRACAAWVFARTAVEDDGNDAGGIVASSVPTDAVIEAAEADEAVKMWALSKEQRGREKKPMRLAGANGRPSTEQLAAWVLRQLSVRVDREAPKPPSSSATRSAAEARAETDASLGAGHITLVLRGEHDDGDVETEDEDDAVDWIRGEYGNTSGSKSRSRSTFGRNGHNEIGPNRLWNVARSNSLNKASRPRAVDTGLRSVAPRGESMQSSRRGRGSSASGFSVDADAARWATNRAKAAGEEVRAALERSRRNRLNDDLRLAADASRVAAARQDEETRDDLRRTYKRGVSDALAAEEIVMGIEDEERKRVVMNRRAVERQRNAALPFKQFGKTLKGAYIGPGLPPPSVAAEIERLREEEEEAVLRTTRRTSMVNVEYGLNGRRLNGREIAEKQTKDVMLRGISVLRALAYARSRDDARRPGGNNRSRIRKSSMVGDPYQWYEPWDLERDGTLDFRAFIDATREAITLEPRQRRATESERTLTTADDAVSALTPLTLRALAESFAAPPPNGDLADLSLVDYRALAWALVDRGRLARQWRQRTRAMTSAEIRSLCGAYDTDGVGIVPVRSIDLALRHIGIRLYPWEKRALFDRFAFEENMVRRGSAADVVVDDLLDYLAEEASNEESGKGWRARGRVISDHPREGESPRRVDVREHLAERPPWRGVRSFVPLDEQQYATRRRSEPRSYG